MYFAGIINISETITEHQSQNSHEDLDHEKVGLYYNVYHSVSIEGATLTAAETQLLLDEGIMPTGKPLQHNLMIKDYFNAFQRVIKLYSNQVPINLETIQMINAYVMKHTGSVHETIFGKIDASKGEFRKGNVYAGNSYFINYDKVIPYTASLVRRIQESMIGVMSVVEQLDLSFAAHLDLVTIHSFYDGNGRTSRLLMNYIQRFYNLPLAIVFKEDSTDYFDALQQSRKQENAGIFKDFMYAQYHKLLQNEIAGYKKMRERPELKPKFGNGSSLFF